MSFGLIPYHGRKSNIFVRRTSFSWLIKSINFKVVKMVALGSPRIPLELDGELILETDPNEGFLPLDLVPFT